MDQSEMIQFFEGINRATNIMAFGVGLLALGVLLLCLSEIVKKWKEG